MPCLLSLLMRLDREKDNDERLWQSKECVDWMGRGRTRTLGGRQTRVHLQRVWIRELLPKKSESLSCSFSASCSFSLTGKRVFGGEKRKKL